MRIDCTARAVRFLSKSPSVVSRWYEYYCFELLPKRIDNEPLPV